MRKVDTKFSALSEGYEFWNYFEVKLPVKFSLPLVGEIDLNNVVFGLCGGMCYSALDYFYAKKKPPQFPRPEEIELPLLTYLCERQIDSLTIPALIKIIEWMSRGDDELALRVLRDEIPALRRSLDKGAPVVLCLIRASAGGNATNNHQVVATGFDLESVPGSIVITLYDPNHPLNTPTITAKLTRSGFTLKQSTGEELRGFFRMPYKPRVLGLPRITPSGEVSFDIEAARPEPPFRLSWPVDSRRVNQMFGENPATYKPFGLAGHEGIDFYAPSGARIYASFDGTVTEAKYRGAYGNQVRIRHEHNGIKFTTVYAHLEKILATSNQPVKAGDLIGLADNTGNSRGSHLHFTLFIEGQKTPGYYDGIVDPWLYFEGNEPPKPIDLSGVVVYTKQQVNLRQLPTTEANILTLLPAGESLPVFGVAEEVKRKIGREGEWLQVKTGGGQTGYIAAWLAQDSAGEVLLPSGVIVYPFDDVPLRSGPGLGLGQVGIAGPNTPLNILGNADSVRAKVGLKDQWLQVLAPDSTRGFVPAWLVRLTGDVPPPAGLFVTPTIDLNLRAAPDTTADIMAVLLPGDSLKVVGEKAQATAKIGIQDQWINIQAPNGVVGWVAAWFVKVSVVSTDGNSGGQPTPKGLIVFPTAEAGINLRGAPDVDAMRIDGALKNEPLTVIDSDIAAARKKIGVTDQWLYVQKAGGKRGWAAAWFLAETQT